MKKQAGATNYCTRVIDDLGEIGAAAWQGLLGPAEVHQPAAELHFRHDLPAQDPQGRLLALVQLPGHTVDHAQRAKGVALGCDQRHARIKADVRISLHQRIVREAWILRGIRHEHQVGLVQRMGAEGDLTGGLLLRQPDRRLEPLARFVDQADQGDRGLADVRRERGEIVEGRLTRGVQHLQGTQCREALVLPRGTRRRFAPGIGRVAHGQGPAGGVNRAAG